MENNIKDEYFELINSTLEKMKLLYVSGVDRIPFKDVQEYSPVLLLVEEKKPTEALTHEVSNTFPLRIIFAGINFSAEDCESIKKITTGIGLTSNQVDIVMGNAGELQENLRNKEVEVIVVFGREAVDA
ncbi:MAG: hypothetical protein KAT46_07650, partial [Deltaproteobacteria bacterium]|nr:hypothetical protein [Deltaproteobacteria bacterium]